MATTSSVPKYFRLNVKESCEAHARPSMDLVALRLALVVASMSASVSFAVVPSNDQPVLPLTSTLATPVASMVTTTLTSERM